MACQHRCDMCSMAEDVVHLLKGFGGSSFCRVHPLAEDTLLLPLLSRLPARPHRQQPLLGHGDRDGRQQVACTQQRRSDRLTWLCSLQLGHMIKLELANALGFRDQGVLMGTEQHHSERLT